MTLLAEAPRDLRNFARFAVVAAVLALGIGATSAIFSLVSAVRLKLPRFADAERPLSPPRTEA